MAKNKPTPEQQADSAHQQKYTGLKLDVNALKTEDLIKKVNFSNTSVAPLMPIQQQTQEPAQPQPTGPQPTPEPTGPQPTPEPTTPILDADQVQPQPTGQILDVDQAQPSQAPILTIDQAKDRLNSGAIMDVTEMDTLQQMIKDNDKDNEGGAGNEPEDKDADAESKGKIFEEQDIIDFMFKEWFLKAADWTANTFIVEPAIWGSMKIGDFFEKKLSSNNGNNISDGNIDDLPAPQRANRTNAAEACEGFFSEQRNIVTQRYSISPDAINDTLAQANSGNFSAIAGLDSTNQAELQAAMSGLPANATEEDKKKAVEQSLRNQRADDIIGMVNATPPKDIPEDKLSPAAAKSLSKHLSGLDKTDPDYQAKARMATLAMTEIDAGYQVALLNTTKAKMGEKLAEGAYDNMSITPDNVGALAVTEAADIDKAMSEKIKSGELNRDNMKDLVTKSARASVSTDNKHLKSVFRDLDLDYNIRKESKLDNQIHITQDNNKENVYIEPKKVKDPKKARVRINNIKNANKDPDQVKKTFFNQNADKFER
ncbi:MAG: hypothetical protein R3Y43_05900 [Alphaproteobacteria bacterium]